MKSARFLCIILQLFVYGCTGPAPMLTPPVMDREEQKQSLVREYADLAYGKPPIWDPVKRRQFFDRFSATSDQFRSTLAKTHWNPDLENCVKFNRAWSDSARDTWESAQRAYVGLENNESRMPEANFRANHLYFGSLSAFFIGTDQPDLDASFRTLSRCLDPLERERLMHDLEPLLISERALIESFYGVPGVNETKRLSDDLGEEQGERNIDYGVLASVVVTTAVSLLAWEYVFPRAFTALGREIGFSKRWARVPQYGVAGAIAAWANTPAGRRYLTTRRRRPRTTSEKAFDQVLDGFIQFRGAPMELTALRNVVSQYEVQTAAQSRARMEQIQRQLQELETKKK